MSRLQLELHRRNRKILEEEEVQTYKECETKQERVERRKTRDHIIDFANAKVIDKGNYKNLKTLESWHIAITDEADNNSNTLPAQYAILLRKELNKH